MNQDQGDEWASELGMCIVSVEYRLAPEYPAPAAIDDCITAWQWILENAATRNFDTSRLVIGGQSAGGGLSAALAQRIYDQGGIQPVLQLLSCPMLDDRTVVNCDPNIECYIWAPKNNRFGWTSYLGLEPGRDIVPEYSVPARRKDLSGLPPAWIGVGDVDLFLAEDVEYARRLKDAGSQVDLQVYPGAFHGFESMFPDNPLSMKMRQAMTAAIARAIR